MVCVIEDAAAAEAWSSIVELRRFLASDGVRETRCVAFVRDGGSWRLEPRGLRDDSGSSSAGSPRERILVPLTADCEDEVLASGATIPARGRSETTGVAAFLAERFASGGEPFMVLDGAIEPAARTVFRMYLPLVVGGYRARLAGRSFVTAHLAQTLDGRIACANGHSQWISNEANLHHAHRLRALHDAVMVGARTVASDDPQLTVRHVEGENPHRVVLSARGSVLSELASSRVFDGGGTLVCRTSERERAAELERRDVAVVSIEPDASGTSANGSSSALLAPSAVGAALADRGLHSIFLEGGGRTLSSFLEARAIDVLHVHIAPLILGSGISGFSLAEVATVQAGARVCMEHFSMDGELLLECRRGHPGEGTSTAGENGGGGA